MPAPHRAPLARSVRRLLPGAGASLSLRLAAAAVLSIAMLSIAALSIAALPIAALSAQNQSLLQPRSDTPPELSVALDLQAFNGSKRPGGSGFARLDIDNRNREPQSVRVRLATMGADSLELIREVALEPGQRRQLDLVFPRIGQPLQLSAELPNGSRANFTTQLGVGGGQLGLLLVGARPSLWADVAGEAFDRGGSAVGIGRPTAEPASLAASAVPTDWRGLTGFDLIVADAGDPLLDAQAIDSLLRYARAGGRLVIDRADRSRDPALARLRAIRDQQTAAADPAATPVATGFGAVLLSEGGSRAGLELATLQGVRKMLFAPSPWAVDIGVATGRADPVPPRHFGVQGLSGIARVPADLFLAVVLGFVILVGPVNHVLLRRRGRAWMVLLTVPVAGALVTGGILLVTFLVEGGSIRGTRQTWTEIDQATRRATVHQRTTLFAGVAPQALRPTRDTWLSTSIVHLSSLASFPGADLVWRSTSATEPDALAGALLPARRPVALLTLEDHGARDRLGFQVREDGRLEVLDGTALRPQRGEGQMVLTLPGGGHFVMDADGLLAPVSPARADTVFRSLIQSSDPPRTLELRRGLPGGAAPSRAPLGASWPALESGSYLCTLDTAPGFADGLGLEVEWSEGQHLLHGRFGTEDVRR